MNKKAYIKTLGLNTCRDILKNAPAWAKYWITGNEYHIDFHTFPNMAGRFSVYVPNLRHEMTALDESKPENE